MLFRCCSPVYLDSTVNMKVAVKRILWGKCANAGQTCIAPDYVLCTKEVQQLFVKEAAGILHGFYNGNPQDSPDYCHIISDKHFK